MTGKQNEVVELMKRLGSKGHTVIAGQLVRISLPFREDIHPNITVWPNGSWHDFSGRENVEKWAGVGLLPHGSLKDLQDSVGDRFPKMWNEMGTPSHEGHLYIEKRALRAGLIRSFVNRHDSIAFPIKNEFSNVIGIQTRRIDGDGPKNQMVQGSDGKNGLFISHLEGPEAPLIVCEGATDTYTDIAGFNMIGVISCAMLDGVKRFLQLEGDIFPKYILALDADDPGRAAQADILSYMLSIGIPHEKIMQMIHTKENKDLNDEWCNCHTLLTEMLPEQRSDLFVKVVDSITPEMESAVWIDFWPPDFPKMEHSKFVDVGHPLYVFPESFGRAAVNKLMWLHKTSAYILRGF